jgi:hypothetical protein
MNNNTNKEKWIDDVLSSTTGLMRAQPPAGLYQKVIRRIASPVPVRIGGWQVTRWAAAAVLLVAVNISSVIYFNSHNKQATTTNNSLVAAIQSETTYNY